MDPRRAQTERNMLPAVGPRFFREGGEVLFEFVIDSSNVLGPRPATRADQVKHAGAWDAFTAAEGVSALDRDASGSDGGSLPAESPAVPAAAPYWNETRGTMVVGEGGLFVTSDGQEFDALRDAADHETAPKRRGRKPKAAQ